MTPYERAAEAAGKMLREFERMCKLVGATSHVRPSIVDLEGLYLQGWRAAVQAQRDKDAGIAREHERRDKEAWRVPGALTAKLIAEAIERER